MNFGDQVIYVEKGVEYSATAMLVSNLEAHAGKNSEPALGLAFFKRPFVPEYRYDVRHQSVAQGAYWKDAAPEAAPVALAVAIPADDNSTYQELAKSDGNSAKSEGNSGSADEAKE